ncbi:type II toxin-antitoxin system ParD family antitoxin [Corticibacterium sp. UT-5YL-CI-8]|nr:type II toxin-antitoxin system ParD family antitoxin [Tianweitania sp. UT-5YL-CI-8]
MSNVEKVSIALSSELLGTIKDAVASGQYASASEVVREALREWNLRQPLRQAEIERLRKAWSEGLDSGAPESIDFDDVKRRGRELLKRAGSR